MFTQVKESRRGGSRNRTLLPIQMPKKIAKPPVISIEFALTRHYFFNSVSAFTDSFTDSGFLELQCFPA